MSCNGEWPKQKLHKVQSLTLQDILRFFGKAKDPLLESSRLLEQSQAHFIAALRQALRSITITFYLLHPVFGVRNASLGRSTFHQFVGSIDTWLQ